ncbi:MAG: hypothetical protein HUU25_02245 [Candidatus Sumerlaeia bacterium]|nr:hypothetical protein [Candidatus Sumerlaeia bacterium]
MPRVSVSNPLLAMRIAWIAFVGALFVYIGAVLFLVHSGLLVLLDSASLHFTLRTVFIALSTVQLAVVFAVVPRIRDARMISGRTEAQRDQIALVVFFIRAALIEAIAIYGLVLTMLFGQMLEAVAFAVVALVGLVLIFPRGVQTMPPGGDSGPWYTRGHR